MSGQEPDYTRYSLAELLEARRAIVAGEHPARAARLDLLIADRQRRQAATPKAIDEPPPRVVGVRGSVKRGRAMSLIEAAG